MSSGIPVSSVTDEQIEDLLSYGFGVPFTDFPHQLIIRIPKSRTAQVEIWEDFGTTEFGTPGQKICRAMIPRKIWKQIVFDVQSYLNQRLKKQRLKGSRFKIGNNYIEIGLGYELCVLAWGMEYATPEQAEIAFTRWSCYRPEELLWLFRQIDSAGGQWDSSRTGWREAIGSVLILNKQKPHQSRQQRGNIPAIRGFGVPNIDFPHHFVVRIPKNRMGWIEIWEDFGTCEESLKFCRAIIPRKLWNRIKTDLQKHLNRRLKEKNIRPSSFKSPSDNSDNPVERILGREVCILAWALEHATPKEARIIFEHWTSYRPEELWWLFQQVLDDGGDWHSPVTGWRAAIRPALLQDISGHRDSDLFSSLLKNCSSGNRSGSRKVIGATTPASNRYRAGMRTRKKM